MVHTFPIAVFPNAVAYYSEDGSQVCHEGRVELYEDYVRLCGGIGSWVPLENVEQVLEQ
ncbi:hypothetical protein [Salinigranum rubrum]|uniref:hypothetical protein n=1 Tax=Salinigranum rubrum TaxID=755307 RepID=UPI00156FDB27|nr:hypothetical protein [Salinigranum rubrum]